MGLDDPTAGLLGDDPVSDEAKDVLGRGPFAERIAELIEHVAAETQSAVLALMGPWGSGKTSVLHFVRRRLGAGGRWRVVEFNPWMVSDLPTLVQEFFTTLVAALPDDHKGQVRQKMAGYAKAVAPLAAPFRLFGVSAEQAFRTAGDVLAGDQSIEARRKELEEALRECDAPVLLVADDLDRLHPDELLLIFKLVRLVGRLPNVYYLLAFDEATVLDVLTSTELAGGDRSRALAYLEKMVQVRLDLPPVHPRLAGQLLDDLLDALTAKHDITLDDRSSYRLRHAYQTHLARYLAEPRQVKRYCAQIEALYPLVAAEVDFVDFAIVSFLRTFHPGVVVTLAAHKEELTGTAIELGNKPTPEQRRNTWRERLVEAGITDSDVDGVLDLLGQLFLPIKSALERVEYGSGFHAELAAARRVGASEYFDRYFHLGIGPDDLPDAIVVAALAEVLNESAGESWAAASALLPTNADLVLDKLRRQAPATPEAAVRLLPALAAIEAEVPDSGFLGRARVVYLSWSANLLRVAGPVDAVAFAQDMARSAGVPFLADICVRAMRSAEKDDQPLSASFEAIKQETVRLIREELDRQATHPPEETAGVIALLAGWGTLEPASARRSWMRAVVEGGSWPLPEVLGLFVSTGRVMTGEGPSRPALADMQFGFLDEVLGIQYVAENVDDLPDPADDSFFGDSDVSWNARVLRAGRAVARRIADQPSTPEPGEFVQ